MSERFHIHGRFSNATDVSIILAPRVPQSMETDAKVSVNLSAAFTGVVQLQAATNVAGEWVTVQSMLSGGTYDYSPLSGFVYRLYCSELSFGGVTYDLFVSGISDAMAHQAEAYGKALSVRANSATAIAARVARLLRNVQSAKLSNPRINGLYPGGIVPTDNGPTLPAGTQNGYLFTQSVFGIWNFCGGTPTLASGAPRFTSAVIAATGGNVGTNDGKYATVFRASAMADSRYLTVRLQPSTAAYRLLLDDKYVDLTGTVLGVTAGATSQYLLYDLGTRALRKVTIEGQQASGFQGCYVGPTESMFPVSLLDATYAATIADSYGDSSGATAKGDGLFQVLADYMGWLMHASASGGTGWATAVNYRFDERIVNGDLALGAHPLDIALFMASYNDRAQTPATITANALRGLKAARNQLSGVPFMVFGAFPGNTGPSAGILAAEAAVRAAVTAFADPLTAFIPVSADQNGPWISGTGKIGTTTGTGNSDIYTIADGVHLSDAGHAFAGKRMAASVVIALKALYARYS